MSEINAMPTQDVWDRAVVTLANMCIDEKIGRGPTKEAFILTLRLYADYMEETLSRPSARPLGSEPSVDWVIIYKDADRSPELFTDEAIARSTFNERSVVYSCHLFHRVSPNE